MYFLLETLISDAAGTCITQNMFTYVFPLTFKHVNTNKNAQMSLIKALKASFLIPYICKVYF